MVGIDLDQTSSSPDVDNYIYADVSNPSDIECAFSRMVEDQVTGLDALINNAGIQICKPIIETTVEEWDRIMNTNVRSAFLCSTHAYPLLRKRKGTIINVSSVHAIATSEAIAAYAASKGAVVALTRAMALEFGNDGIRVNAVLPGAVDTGMLRAGLIRGHAVGRSEDELIIELGERHPMGDVGSPNDIAELFFFLSDGKRSRFITGQAFVIDGGALARLSTE